METSKDGNNTENTSATKTEQNCRNSYTLEEEDSEGNIKIRCGLTLEEILPLITPEQREQLLHGTWTKAQAEEGKYYDENGKLRERKQG